MTFISLILGFVLGAAAIIFALQNNEMVALSFLGWQFESSLALVIILATAVGTLLGVLLSVPSIIRRSFAIMSLKRANRGLHDEAQTLRDMHEQDEAKLQADTTSAVAPDTIDLRQP
ncbi:MAG: LapA family protein [Patescibacteria group bacterium]